MSLPSSNGMNRFSRLNPWQTFYCAFRQPGEPLTLPITGRQQAAKPAVGAPVHGLVRRHIESFDHVVGSQQNGFWNRDAECSGTLEIDHQLKLGRLLDGQVTWFRTLEYLGDVSGCTSIQVTEVRAIGYQCACVCERTVAEHRQSALDATSMIIWR